MIENSTLEIQDFENSRFGFLNNEISSDLEVVNGRGRHPRFSFRAVDICDCDVFEGLLATPR